ncbi:MAG: HAD family hydrolase [Planctomycetota bacterium]|nr:HAD family hydrolase [Planctomycetota bacterium]
MAADPITPPIRGVLFDVDGTLYHAWPMRIRLALALLALPFFGWRKARRTWRCIKCYRTALEEIRHAQPDGEAVGLAHLRRAADLAGEDVDAIKSTIEEWVMRRPLRYLRRCRRKGLLEFLDDLRRRNIQIGFFSDYPAAAKLAALEVDGYASICLSAGDPEINAFKPWPQGFLRASKLFALSCEEVLYIGDRPNVDAVGATNAGMRCAILGRGTSSRQSAYLAVTGFADLGSLWQDLS